MITIFKQQRNKAVTFQVFLLCCSTCHYIPGFVLTFLFSSLISDSGCLPERCMVPEVFPHCLARHSGGAGECAEDCTRDGDLQGSSWGWGQSPSQGRSPGDRSAGRS
jgi:hypothetical protein